MDEQLERADKQVTQDLPQTTSTGVDASGDKRIVSHSTLTRTESPEYDPNERNTSGSPDNDDVAADAPTPTAEHPGEPGN